MIRTVLITRPEEEYADTASMVTALGYQPVACPMLKVETITADFSDIQKFQALIFTSAGALPPFCAQCDVRDIAVYTVGDVTAERARQAGFTKVTSAGADLAALEVLLRSENLSGEEPVLHVSGVDIVRAIDVPNLTVERRVVYRAGILDHLPESAQMEIRSASPAFVLFYSARTAQAFAEAIKKDRLAHQLMSTKALCLSDSMVESLRDLPWRGIRVSSRPDRAGMQELLAEEKGMDTLMNTSSENTMPEDQNAIEPAEQVIERFGGIRPMASKMSVPVTTVQGWKKRNVIPGNRREDVIRAARQNNIEISDILNKSVANDTSFSAVMNAAKTAESAAYTPRVTEPSAPVREGIDLEALMSKIKQSEGRAVKKSAAITVTVVSAVAIAAAILLGPGTQGTFDKTDVATGTEVQALREDVERIDADVNSVKEDQFALKNLIPENLGQTMDELKGSVSTLGAQVGTLAESAKGAAAVIATDVMGPHAGDVTQRMAALQTQVQAVTDSTDIAGLLARFAELKKTASGEQLMDKSSDQLMELLRGLNGDMTQLEPKLQEAQAQNTELGQTLAGVPPTDLKAAAALMALTQFRTSLHRSAPFEEDLVLLQQMVGKDDPELQEAIARLAPQASKGVLSPKGVSDQLKGLTGDIVVSSLKGEDVSIREKAAARMNEVLQVQKDGELVTGTDTQATIARAQKLLDEGNIDDAVIELQSLQGPARETAQPVIDQAMMTALAQQVSTMMTGKVSAQLPAPASGVDIGDAFSQLMGGISGMSPENIGTSLGQAVKGAGGKSAPYTTGGGGLEGVMKTMEGLGAPGTGVNEPIHFPQQ